MTLVISLYCQGNHDQCPASFLQTGGQPSEARMLARAAGWQCEANSTRDLCPSCRVQEERGILPPGTCRACHGRIITDFADALGHDLVGHRAGNLLISEGITTWQQFLALSPPRLRKLRGLGQAGTDRIAAAQKGVPQGEAP